MMKKKKNDQITDFNRKKNLVAQYTRNNNNTEEERIDKDPNGAKRTKNSQRRTEMLTF